MASKTVGIQQLLASEKKAAEMIAEARRRKNKRLKAAKDEAAVEVEAYRKERESEFAAYEHKHLGNKAEISARIDAETKAQLIEMAGNVDTRKNEVLGQLLDTMSDIEPKVHQNLQ